MKAAKNSSRSCREIDGYILDLLGQDGGNPVRLQVLAEAVSQKFPGRRPRIVDDRVKLLVKAKRIIRPSYRHYQLVTDNLSAADAEDPVPTSADDAKKAADSEFRQLQAEVIEATGPADPPASRRQAAYAALDAQLDAGKATIALVQGILADDNPDYDVEIMSVVASQQEALGATAKLLRKK